MHTVGGTCVDEASRCAFAELFGFVGQRDLHHPGDVSGRSLHSNGMGRDELWRAREGKKINAMKLHIQTCARGTVPGSPQTFSFAAFDFLSLYNQPENDVLALKPSGGPRSPRQCHCEA